LPIFALSFDEVVVTTFMAGAQDTLTLDTLGAMRLGRQSTEVNVVVVGVLNLAIL
jgi:putative spermidine/putrescine transport system permease protein